MFPLETAEKNVRRLAFDDSIELPYPEACVTCNDKFNIVRCPDCSAAYCSPECMTKAEVYHKMMCASFMEVDRINEIWKYVKKF